MSGEMLEPRRFQALAGEWTPEELCRFFWLTPEDLLQVRTCRGAANRLGFALNLLLLRLLHCPFPDVTFAPPRIVQFVFMQQERASRRARRVQPPTAPNARRASGADSQLPQAVSLLPSGGRPPPGRISALAGAPAGRPGGLAGRGRGVVARRRHPLSRRKHAPEADRSGATQAESQLFAQITRHLSAAQTQALEDLLLRDQGKRGSILAWLKEPAVKATPASIKTLLAKLETVRQTRVSALDLSRLNRNRVRVLAHLGEKYHRDSLLRFSAQKREALLVCYLQELQQELLDRLLTSFNDLVQGIFRRTEQKENRHHVKQGKALTQHVHTFRKIARIVLDPSIPNAEVRPRIFAVVPQTELQEAYDDAGAKARPEDGQAFDLLDHHYTFLRKFLPDLLTALEFTGTSAARPVLQAIEVLKRMDAEGRRRLPLGTPMHFLPADWRKAIADADGVTAKHLWELGLAEQMRQLLRSSDLSVPGSRQHKVWTSYLHSPAAWADRKVSWFARWHGAPSSPDIFDLLENDEAIRQFVPGLEWPPFFLVLPRCSTLRSFINQLLRT